MILSTKTWTLVRSKLFTVPHRWRKPWKRGYLLDLWERRQLVGPEEPKPRSIKPNWNYDVELYAFKHRLQESFTESNLRRAFIHPSYVENQEKQAILLQPSVSETEAHPISLKHNENFVQLGGKFTSQYVKAYLRAHLPKYPEEGIEAIHDYLTTTDKLAVLAKHLGAYDLILADKYPHDQVVAAETFQAIVGALLTDSGSEKAGNFVQDFVLTQLVEEDINELWYFQNPWQILCAFLKFENMNEPECRILRESGRNTVTPVYVMGIYCGDQLLGTSAGESEKIATEMACRDSLKRLWKAEGVQFNFGTKGHQLDLKRQFEQPNWTVRNCLGINVQLDPTLFQEPLDAQQIAVHYKEGVEKVVGTPYRRRLKHRFYPGTPGRRTPRRFIAPKAKTI